MKKMIAIVLALGFPGCTGLPSLSIATDASRNTLFGITNSYGIALSAETTYKNLCAQGLADSACRDNVAKMQVADKKAIGTIVAANDFIKEYPTVSAVNVLGAAQSAVDSFQAITGGK